jgi:glycosyltransferase involved in cell wall biosynthesis
MNEENCPLVSVVTSCYNSENYIAETIKTVNTQTYQNWEMIIINDCSTDNSLKIIRKCISRLHLSNKIKIINHSTNLGCGSSLSDAINNSSGELIAILDSDDALATKDALKLMVETHLKHPEASLVYSNYWECDHRLKKLRRFRTRQISDHETYLGTKIRISHFKVMKRSFYDKTPGVNRLLRQTVDKDLVLKLEEVGKLIHIPIELYLYRQRHNNLTKSVNKKGKEYKTFVKIMRYKTYNDARSRRGLKLKNVEEIEQWEKTHQKLG